MVGHRCSKYPLSPSRFPAVIAGHSDARRGLGLFLARRTAHHLPGVFRNDLPELFAGALNYFVGHLISGIIVALRRIGVKKLSNRLIGTTRILTNTNLR